MRNDYFKKYSGCGFSSNLTSETSYEELAFMKAVIDGFVQAVHIFIEFLDPNFGDMFDRPFLNYVYMNKDEASRRDCLEIIIPRLVVSEDILCIAAENGDLSSVKYLVNEMKSSKQFMYVTATRKAIEGGHDEVAKWIITQPGLIPWERYTGTIVFSAAKMKNYDMLVFLSQCAPDFELYSFGTNVIEALWKLLKDKDEALFKKFVPRHSSDHSLLPKY